jgi:hypothetical protein
MDCKLNAMSYRCAAWDFAQRYSRALEEKGSIQQAHTKMQLHIFDYLQFYWMRSNSPGQKVDNALRKMQLCGFDFQKKKSC